MKIIRHQDGTVTLRLPSSSLQGRGLGADDVLHGLRQAANLFAKEAFGGPYARESAQLRDRFNDAADELEEALR